MPSQIIWAMRSDNANFNARYSPAGITPGVSSQSVGTFPAYEADAAAIGGFRYNMGQGGAFQRNLTYPARGIFNTKTISINFRVQVLASGLLGMYNIASGANPLLPNRFMFYQNSDAWKTIVSDYQGVVLQNSLALGTQAADTAHYQDFTITWDGTTAANAVKFYIDAVNVGNGTSGGSWANPQDASLTDFINIGSSAVDVGASQMYVNEMTIWNYVINPSSVALVSGTGALNGASRTSFVNVTSYNGLAGGGGQSRSHLGPLRIG